MKNISGVSTFARYKSSKFPDRDVYIMGNYAGHENFCDLYPDNHHVLELLSNTFEMSWKTIDLFVPGT